MALNYAIDVCELLSHGNLGCECNCRWHWAAVQNKCIIWKALGMHWLFPWVDARPKELVEWLWLFLSELAHRCVNLAAIVLTMRAWHGMSRTASVMIENAPQIIERVMGLGGVMAGCLLHSHPFKLCTWRKKSVVMELIGVVYANDVVTEL